MNSHDSLRPGTYITLRDEPLTVLRVLGGTVVLRDRRGHTRRLWADKVIATLEAQESAPAESSRACPDAMSRACASLGLTAQERSAASSHAEAVAAYLHDVEEYARDVFDDRLRRRNPPAHPRPVVHLFAVPETTPPHAA